MSYKLIGISGKKNSGKNTLLRFLKDEIHFRFKQRVTDIAFADPIKKAAMIMFPSIDSADLFGDSGRRSKVVEGHINPETGEPLTIRDVLLQIGKWGRQTNPNTWIDAVLPDIRDNILTSNVVVADCRFANEKAIIESFPFNGIVVRLIRTNVENTASDESETTFDGGEHVFYRTIINDTIDSLAKQANELVTDLFSK